MAYKDPLDPRRKEAERRYYEANKNHPRYAQHRERDQLAKRAIVHEAKDVPCADCKKRYPVYVMQFDHVRGIKKFNIGNYGSHGRLQVLKEIAKCDVVCANCHAERTHQRLISETVSHELETLVD